MDKKKKKPNKIFLLIFMGIGLILILDGLVSIALQPDQVFLFQAGRIFRVFMGSSLFLISFLIYNKKNISRNDKK